MTGLASLPASLKGQVAALLHPSVAGNSTESAMHSMFIATRLMIACLVIAAAPVFLVLHGVPALWHALAFFWMIFPLLSVAVLAHSGRTLPAQAVCVVSLFGLSLTFAIGGGLGLALSWLLLVPLEAALSQNATTIIVASAMTVLTSCGLYVAQTTGFLPEISVVSSAERIALLLPGIVYGATLAQMAVAIHRLHRKAELIGAARLQSLSDAIGDLVLRQDRLGNVLFASAESAGLFGLPSRELMGRGFFEHVHVADRPAFLKTMADAARQSETIAATLRLRTGQCLASIGNAGEPVFAWIEIRVRRIPDHIGTGPETPDQAVMVAVVRDVTARMRHEEELETARTKAEQASIWKDRFLANVSHELRTPLNAIIGFSEMLGSEELSPRQPEKQREYAHIIHESGQHLLSVVNTILDMSKIEAGSFELTPEPFDLPPLVSQCCDIVSLRARKGGVELVRDCPANLDELVADRRACKQILINLLSNAVKFTKEGGRVIIGARPDGNSLRIYVSDNGIGIQARDLPRLGDPFFQAAASYDRSYEGTGLGLSVVRGLVGLHGGDIKIESAPSVGTCVTIRLPLDCRQATGKALATARIETVSKTVVPHSGLIALNLSGVKKSA